MHQPPSLLPRPSRFAPLRTCGHTRPSRSTSADGTIRSSASAARVRAKSATAGARPRWISRLRRCCLPRLNWLRIVPTGRPNRRAACPSVRPSMSQSTTAARYRSGSESISAWTTSVRSSSRGSIMQGSARPATLCSCRRRRHSAERAWQATRRATPCSQLARDAGCLIERARRASTRNVA